MSDQLDVVRAAALERAPSETWLVYPLWSSRAVGCLGGPPKTGKSWLGLDLAVSVASCTPALGRFEVQDPGPVLIYMAEDALAAVRSRIDGICRHRGLDIEALDLHVITNPTLRLDIPIELRRLRNTVARLRPRLLLLDPLVRLHRVNENQATEISQILGSLREIQRSFDVAIILTHHVSKRARADSGQALRGSGDLWAFGDSNLYLAPHGPHALLTVEHRSAKAPEPVLLHLATDPDGNSAHLAVADATQPPPARSPQDAVLDALGSSSFPLTALALRAALRINNKRLYEILSSLERLGHIERSSSGWRLHRSVPTAPIRDAGTEQQPVHQSRAP